MDKRYNELRLFNGDLVLTPGLHLFVGRPGSGKTTMIAKAVCNWVMSGSKEIILNSLDVCVKEMKRMILSQPDMECHDKSRWQRLIGYVCGREIVACPKLEDLAEICTFVRPCAVIIDTVHLVVPPGAMATGWASAGWPPQTKLKIRLLAQLAELLGVPILATAIQSRDGHIIGCDCDEEAFGFANTVTQISRDGNGCVSVEVVKGGMLSD